jgi:hypothetical protein
MAWFLGQQLAQSCEGPVHVQGTHPNFLLSGRSYAVSMHQFALFSTFASPFTLQMGVLPSIMIVQGLKKY